MYKVKILIIDIKKDFVEKINNIISQVKNMKIIGTIHNGYLGILESVQLKPDIILIADDLEAPGSGISAARALLAKFPYYKIILLTDNQEGNVVYSALSAGMIDYISKNASPSEIIYTIQKVYKSKHTDSRNMADKYYNNIVCSGEATDSFMYTLNVVSQLTPAELNIVKLILEGKNHSQIAEIRNTNIYTIRDQIKIILKKFNKKSANDLVKVLRRLNITEFIDHTV